MSGSVDITKAWSMGSMSRYGPLKSVSHVCVSCSQSTSKASHPARAVVCEPRPGPTGAVEESASNDTWWPLDDVELRGEPVRAVQPPTRWPPSMQATTRGNPSEANPARSMAEPVSTTTTAPATGAIHQRRPGKCS
jgi:hypothetical protein